MGSLVIQKVNLNVKKKTTIFLTKTICSFGKDRVCDSTGTKSKEHFSGVNLVERWAQETPKVMGESIITSGSKLWLLVVSLQSTFGKNWWKSSLKSRQNGPTKIAAASLWKKHATFAMDAWPAMKAVSSDKAPFFSAEKLRWTWNKHWGAELLRKCPIYIVKRLERLRLHI